MALKTKVSNEDNVAELLQGVSVDKSSSSDHKPDRQKYKIQIQLSQTSKQRLDHLVECTDAESSTQVIRDALRVYDVLAEELTAKGSSLYLVTDDGQPVKLRLF